MMTRAPIDGQQKDPGRLEGRPFLPQSTLPELPQWPAPVNTRTSGQPGSAGSSPARTHCEWSGWFRAHYQDWTKPPSDFDSARWMLDHTALVNEARESREKLGYEVFTEGQNSFRLRGKLATLAGKPDLIALKGSDASDHRREDWEARASITPSRS